MPHNLTEVSTFTANVSVPDTGDARTAASVETPFQAVANRTKALKDASDLSIVVAAVDRGNLKGLIVGPRNVYSNGNDLVVESFFGLNIGSQHYGEQAATTVTPGSTSNSTWHYLYAKDDVGGGITYERSTTAPSASQTYQVGAPTRLYICSYYVNGSGNIVQFRKVGNKYIWRRSGSSAFPTNVISGGNAVTYTTKSCAIGMSPLSRVAGFIAELAADPTGAVAQFITNGDSTSNNTYAIHASPSSIVNAYFEMEVNSSRELQYKVDDSGAGLDLDVTHYYE